MREENNTDARVELYRQQKNLLDTFLERGAITRAQYEKSLGTLREKMQIDE